MLKPITLHIEGLVTDTPINAQNVWRAYGAAGFGAVPSKAAHKVLYNLWLQRQPFDYVGGLQVYKNMVLTAYDPVRNTKTGGTLQFTATMQQVRMVASQTVQSLKPAQAKKSLGTQKPAIATPVMELGASRYGGLPQSVEPTAQTQVPFYGNITTSTTPGGL